jgi:hypothetical protein
MMESELRVRFGNAAVDLLLDRIHSGRSPELNAPLLNAQLANTEAAGRASELLDAAAAAGVVERIAAVRCPVPTCKRILSPETRAVLQCPYCGTDLRELGEDPVETVVYRASGLVSRDIPWFIAIHGMNTRGEWQEEFSWRIANMLRYHAPVFIYKYGLIRFSVLVRWRHRALARQLGQRIRAAAAHARAHQIIEPPDVLIHSFGSQLFRLVLEMDEFADLRFGRVIAAGSIIRPDFDWSGPIEQGRIEAVLCHCAGKDKAVPLAQIFIPGTGPGGKHGFPDQSAINVLSPNYGHSDVFRKDVLASNLDPAGLWRRFLVQPAGRFDDGSRFQPASWKPLPGFVRAVLRCAGLLLILAAALLLLTLAGSFAAWAADLVLEGGKLLPAL